MKTFVIIFIACLTLRIDSSSVRNKIRLNCLNPCPFEIQPICAANGKVYKRFTNDCEMKAANCMEDNVWHEVPSVHCDKKILPNKNCTQRCHENFNPICGFDGINHKLFRNNCERLLQECKDSTKWKKSNLKNCSPKDKCTAVCPDMYYCACGFNGHNYTVFSNTCSLEQRNCRDDTNTMIEVPICKCPNSHVILKERCSKWDCPNVYDPVCGSNGRKRRTFLSTCDMVLSNCLNCFNFTLKHTGRCVK